MRRFDFHVHAIGAGMARGVVDSFFEHQIERTARFDRSGEVGLLSGDRFGRDKNAM